MAIEVRSDGKIRERDETASTRWFFNIFNRSSLVALMTMV